MKLDGTRVPFDMGDGLEGVRVCVCEGVRSVGCSKTIEGYLDGGKRPEVLEVSGMAIWYVVASEIETLGAVHGDALDEIGRLPPPPQLIDLV